MTIGYAGQAIESVLNSEKGFCKFLSANDTGATGGHQSGILISKSAAEMLFSRQELYLYLYNRQILITADIFWKQMKK